VKQNNHFHTGTPVCKIPPEPDWLGSALLQPPRQHVTLVQRAGLIAQLAGGAMRRLTILVSPPGFGKTTLLSQWFTHQNSQKGALVSWLSLSAEQNEPEDFLVCLILSISRSGIALDQLASAARSHLIDSDSSKVVMALIAAIRSQPKRLLIILDDYLNLRSPSTDRIVELILEQGGDCLDLAVSGRRGPAFQTAVLATRGDINFIDATDLVLSRDDARIIYGTAVSQSDVALAHTHTEGWAVALQLSRIWLERGKRDSFQLQDFRGHSKEMAVYLTEQVINDLPEHLLGFLLETSIFGHFNSALADAARSRSDSRELLAQLDNFHALLTPTDDQQKSYRYHLMFAEFLLQRLQQNSIGAAEILHQRAARWLAAQGDLNRAVDHALAVPDQSLAIELVRAAGGWEIVMSHGSSYAINLLGKFAPVTIHAEVILQLMQAYVDAKLGLSHRAMAMLRLAEQFRETLGPDQLRDLVVVSALVHFYLDTMTVPAFLGVVETNVALLDDQDYLGRALLSSVAAASAMAWGEPARAARACVIAAQALCDTHGTRGACYVLVQRGSSSMLNGHLREAQKFFMEALASAEENPGDQLALNSEISSFLGYSLYFDNRLQEADDLIARSLQRIRSVGSRMDVASATYEVLTRRTYHQRGLDAAMLVLDEAALLARERELVHLAGLVTAWRIEFLARSGYLAEAKREVAAADLEPLINTKRLPSFAWRVRAASIMAIAELYFANGTSALGWHLLHQSALELSRAGLVFAAHRMQALGMRALKEHQDDERLSRNMEECLSYVAREGGKRIILDCGPGIESVLQSASKHTERFAGHRQAVLEMLLKDIRKEKALPLDEFSASELKVLREVHAGRPNKAIARTLDVSENTIKFHLKNIYRKLGVDSRLGAMAAVAQRDLFRGR